MRFAYKTTARIVCLIIGITGATMIFPFICAAIEADNQSAGVFAILCPVSVVAGILGFRLIPRTNRSLQTRDAYFIVLASWISCALIGAIPYYASGELPTYADAIFEAVAGYTTTGASSMNELSFTDAVILWKAITHWLGGMGILIFIITILPSMGPGGQRIVAAESPGAGLSAGAPRTKDLSRLLYLIYFGMTLIVFLLLFIGSEMGSFEAVINAMGCVSTAGLFQHPAGIQYYDSLYIEMVISIFTILASVNFLLLIYLVKRNFSGIKNNIEIRVFLLIIAVSTFLVATDLVVSNTYDTPGEAFRVAFFQCTAFLTTSGFTLRDYMEWPVFAHMILFTLMFIGGCVASTAGGIKITRLMVMLKLVRRSFFRKLHPRSVKAVKIGDNAISSAMVSSITSFIVLYLGTFLAGSAILSLQGLDLETTLSTTASLMSTTGIAFGKIGSSGSFELYSPAMKLFISLFMMVGRLEMFTVFVALFPSFWNPNKAKVI
jgi:trk system potassium uptake protein TrkH